MITKEEFDKLKVGDVIVNSDNNQYTIIDRLTNTIFCDDEDETAICYSFNEIKENYSIKQTPKHLYGIPFGDYSDKEVYVSYSDISLNNCIGNTAVKLLRVDENGFTDVFSNTWKYAKVVSNNVDLIPYE